MKITSCRKCIFATKCLKIYLQCWKSNPSSGRFHFTLKYVRKDYTMLKTVRKPKLSYYAHGVSQTQLHMDSLVICFITIPIFHNFKLSEASWNLEVQKWWKTVLKIHILKLYIFWSGSAGKLWLGPGCLLGKAQSKSLKGLAGTWGINHNSWLNFGM